MRFLGMLKGLLGIKENGRVRRAEPSLPNYERKGDLTGRRARRLVTIYRAENIEHKLTEKKPSFSTDPAHVYALQAHASGPKKGKPTGAFVRVNKNRQITGKHRKQARHLARLQFKEATAQAVAQ